ncbi:MAG TPA: aminoglycoside 6-adenylyltransferase [Candidatus Dormibacteraeota bacterium]|nr:aminoglycoside 6-adenylyltransferase [Candidatus Dormibacteraeota bacterium]
MEQDSLLATVVRWVRSEENIRLLVLTGSQADPRERDSLSDLDIELYVRDNRSLLRRVDWYHQFGEVLVVEALRNPGWHPTRLVYYAGGKIDFMIAPAAVLDRGVRYRGPYRVLVDKDGQAHRLGTDPDQSGHPPRASDYETCVNWFYAAALMCAKCLVRREPWAAKYRDWDLKVQLLQMITWDHKARYGWDYDTRYLGRRLHNWLDVDLAASLNACWGAFSEESMKAALLSSVDLFDKLSTRTAAALNIDAFDSSRVRSEIRRVLDLRHR